MTAQEAKANIENLEKHFRNAKRGTALYEVLGVFVTLEDLCIAIESMEEVEQYRSLGTVEELKEALEKQVAKKAEKIEPDANNDIDVWVDCPCCGATKRVSKHHNQYYCWKCGQLIELPQPYKKEGA